MPSDITADGQRYFDRVDSYNSPQMLGPTSMFMACNMLLRGGAPKTRPGFSTTFTLPPGNLQGMTSFKPSNGPWQLLWVIEGKLYFSKYPFVEYDVVPNITFNKQIRFITWQSTIQTFDYDSNGVLYPLPNPVNILIIQDGVSRAVSWTGGVAKVLNPSASTRTDENGDIVTEPNRDETPIGTWMAWAGNRLWVAQDNILKASDYGIPTKFTETLYLNEGRALYMPESITGMVQPSYQTPLIVFGQNTMTFIRADVLDRTQWSTVQDFQRSEFGLGCISGRSITKMAGMVWWYAAGGVINLNAGLQTFNDSKSTYLDAAMLASKYNLSAIKDGICGVSFENYLLMSVPSGSLKNRHTWVADMITGELLWNGYWTGIYPVEYAKIYIDGTERLYAASVDEGGVNRIWELFQQDRTDNGCAITGFAQTRYFSFETEDRKRFSHIDLWSCEMENTVDLTVFFNGVRGNYQRLLTKRLEAPQGNIVSGHIYQDGDILFDTVPQSRFMITSEAPAQSDCPSCLAGPATDAYYIDRAFGATIVFSGVFGFEFLRVFGYKGDIEAGQGRCEQNETEQIMQTYEGCTTTLTYVSAINTFVATEEYTAQCADIDVDAALVPIATASATAKSIISELDAKKKATCIAKNYAEGTIDCTQLFVLLDELYDPILDEENNEILA